jgi:hypothetical protein
MKKHKKFSDPHEEIISNEQPITMQDTRNIELIQETLSPKSAPESHVNLQGRCITHPWILSQYSNTPHMILMML